MALATATIIGLTTAAASAGMSFKQAADAKSAAERADTDAKNLMDEAKKNIQKDYTQEQTVSLDAFEAASKENVALQNQSIQAIREGDQRGTFGAVTQLGQDSAEQRRISMGKELSDLQKLKIQSKENIRDEVVSMDVAGAADANVRARDAQQSRTAAMTNAVNALGQGANAYAEGQDLYKKTNKTNTTLNVNDKIAELSAYGTGQVASVSPQSGYGAYSNVGVQGGPPAWVVSQGDAAVMEWFRTN
jgi:hypothetical protein